jgi:hypothetical protein
MAITGHKTEAVCRRYAIVDESDLDEAAAKLAASHERDVLQFPKVTAR